MKVLLFELNCNELKQELTKNHFVCETYAEDEYREALAWQPDVKPIIAIVNLSKMPEIALYKLKNKCYILGLHLSCQKIPDTKVNHCTQIITIKNFQTAAPQIIATIKQNFLNNNFVPLGDHKNILISEKVPICVINGIYHKLRPAYWKICLLLNLNPKKIWTTAQMKYHLDISSPKSLDVHISRLRRFFFQRAGYEVIPYIGNGNFSLSPTVITPFNNLLKVKKETLDFLKEPYIKTSKLIRKLALKELNKLKNKKSTEINSLNHDKHSYRAFLRYLIKSTYTPFSPQKLIQFLKHLSIQRKEA